MLDVCLCLLQVGVLSELAEQVFGAGIPFMYGSLCWKEILDIYKNNGLLPLEHTHTPV